jgi:hypothetical protein
MHDRELDALLDGASGATLVLSSPDGPIFVAFSRHELRSPVAWRARMRRTLAHTGYVPPVYEQEDHDQIVRAMFMLADAEVRACAERSRG